MKIKPHLALLIVFVVLLNACKKSSTQAPATKKLKYLTQVTRVQGTTTNFINYTYDAKNRVGTAKNGTSTTTYTYNGNDLFSGETNDPASGFREIIEYTYNNDGSISSTHDKVYRNNALSSDIVYNYLIVNGRITERHDDIYINKFTYDDKGNRTNTYSAQGNLLTVNTYDDKLSIYTNGFPNPNGVSFSPNNVTSSISTLTSTTYTYTYTYTYDADGYPIAATMSGPPGTETVKYAYTYTEM